jgi:hypothetical protein
MWTGEGEGIMIRNDAEELATPEELISEVVKTVQEATGADIELLDILSANILTMNPAETAVDDAVKAIEALAVKRVEGADNDQHDSD